MLEICQEIVIVNHYFHHCLHCCIHHFIMMISSSIFLSISRPLCQFTHKTFHFHMKNDHICHISKNLQIMAKHLLVPHINVNRQTVHRQQSYKKALDLKKCSADFVTEEGKYARFAEKVKINSRQPILM